MAWVYVKLKDRKQVHYITEEAYEATFKDMGFEIVSNAENDGVKTQEEVGGENIQPTPEKPTKRQYNKRSEA